MKLTEGEYKELILAISKQIAPVVVKKNESSHLASEAIALYALHIAEEIKIAIENPEYIRRKIYWLGCGAMAPGVMGIGRLPKGVGLVRMAPAHCGVDLWMGTVGKFENHPYITWYVSVVTFLPFYLYQMIIFQNGKGGGAHGWSVCSGNCKDVVLG